MSDLEAFRGVKSASGSMAIAIRDARGHPRRGRHVLGRAQSLFPGDAQRDC